MKNLFNLGLIVLLLVVLGCNCQKKLQEIADNSKTPSSTPAASNTSVIPTGSSSPSKGNSDKDLTLDKYNQIKNGMSYKEVVDVMGSEGSQTMSSGEGKYKVESYKWEGDNYQFLSIVFMGDKVNSKVQNGLK